MHKLRKYIKTEMDVEFFACTHAASMIFIYGFLLWVESDRAVTFAVIFEMMVLGYAMAWTQKGLFLQEKEYTRREYILREILWNVLSILYIPVAGELCDWFCGTAGWVGPVFYLIMAIYVVGCWIFLREFYQEETKELNQLLQQRKQVADSRKNKKEDA